MAADGVPHPFEPIQPRDRDARHYLTVLITDLCGSSQLARAMEVEDYGRLIAAVRQVWHAQAQASGALVLRIQGDGALIVLGFPKASETDGWRAAELALSIHEQVAQLTALHLGVDAPALQLRTGIHGGMLLLSEGDVERGRFDLSGDVVNTAAHLQQGAEPGAVLVSATALGPYVHLFDAVAHGHGADAEAPQLQALRVLRRRRGLRRFDAATQRGQVPFIGREEALRQLDACLDDAATAGPRCVVVQGSAGMGKTRLVEEWSGQKRLSKWRVLRGGCESLAAAEVLQPFMQMLGVRRSTLSVDDMLARWTSDGGAQRSLMIIDDWQWADDASRQLLVTLLSRDMGPRVLLACRPREDGGEWMVGAPHLTLQPLDALQTEHMVQHLLPAADPFLAARIHDYAGGVPLFIEELCHSATVNELSRDIEAPGGAQNWLKALVASRLARLPQDEAAVVRAAAVIGTVVRRSLLSLVCDPQPSEQLLERLAEADFLYPDPRLEGLRFKHGITRDAVYESIGLYERTAMHRRIEAALLAGTTESDNSDDAETLAHHARGCGEWERAAHFGERAGDRASAAFALDRARLHYRGALDVLDRMPRRGAEQRARWCALANKLGLTCIFDPLSLPDGLALFERAVAQARQLGDINLLARCLYWLGYFCYGLGAFRDGVRHTRDALEAAHASGDLRLAAQVEATLGQILAAACEYDEALQLMDHALANKRANARPGSGLAVGSAYTLACKAGVLADRGDFPAARGAFDEALRLLGSSTHPVANSARNWVAIAEAWQGHWVQARQIALDSVVIANNTRALLLLAVSRGVLGYARWGCGDAAGIELLRESVRWITARRSQFFLSLFGGWLVEAATAAGDWDAVRREARQVLGRVSQGERLGEAAACRGLAHRAAALGRHGLAAGWLRRAEASARQRASLREAALNHLAAAGVCRASGRAAEADAQHAAGLAACQRLGMDALTGATMGRA